jgi:hypothetical protein
VSYKVAKDCFKENITLTGGAKSDPVSFNLYNGLFQLTQQLERELLEMRERLGILEGR